METKVEIKLKFIVSKWQQYLLYIIILYNVNIEFIPKIPYCI